MNFRTPLSAAVVLVLGLFLQPALGWAQTNTENFAQFEFNFNNPGARATGIGGAFISIADDATAVEANPAGLTTLIRPEFSCEVKGVRFKRKVSNFSHQGNPSSYTVLSREFENSLVSPSFASFVMPFRRFTASLFRHELVNFETSYFTKGSFVPPLRDGSYFFPVRSGLKMRVVNWGAGMGVRLTRGVSAGVSAGLSRMTVNSVLSRYFLEVFDEANLANESTINDDGNSFFVNAGLIVQAMNNLTIGAIFKYRPSFTLKHEFRITDFPRDTVRTSEVHFNVPKAAGLGLSYRPVDELTVSFDALYTFYSDLTKDFSITFAEGTTGGSDYKVDNAIELHAGVEYVWLTRLAGFVFRAGFFNEPDNRIRFTGLPADSPDPNRTFSRQTLAALFRAGDTDFHYTFGVGVVVSDIFQVDVAGNLSNGTDEVVSSVVVRF